MVANKHVSNRHKETACGKMLFSKFLEICGFISLVEDGSGSRGTEMCFWAIQHIFLETVDHRI